MISPSPLERHLDIVRGLGTRSRPLDEAARRSALRRRRAADVDATITIRPAAGRDAAAIARLAELDGRRLPEGRRVVAEAGGRILAVADVRSGQTLADPFEPTAAIAQLLELRARQLRPAA